MKTKPTLIVSISNLDDLGKITKDTKYINLDITNCNSEVISYFIKNGRGYMYSDLIESIPGYNYVSYDDFVMAEKIINNILARINDNYTTLELAKYLYVSIAKYVSLDINIDKNKNDTYDLMLMGVTNNPWGSLSVGTVNNISATKIYYYLSRRVGLNTQIVTDDNKYFNRLLIDNRVLITDIYNDIPYIKCHMKTRYFGNYNDDLKLDKKIKYISTNYMDYYIDGVLKDIDYTKETSILEVLNKVTKVIDIEALRPIEAGIIYKYIFNKYLPNYNIKINNLYLNDHHKLHFLMISYNDDYYSYNYKQKRFIKVNREDILDNITIGKIGLYRDENILNINNYTEFIRENC